MEFLAGAVVGFLACYIAVKIVVWRTLNEIGEQIDIEELMEKIQQQTDRTVYLRIEHCEGTWLAYDVADDSFVAQGKDEASLLRSLQNLGETALIAQGDQQLLDRIREAAKQI
jgi:hypothetical protein